MLCVSVSERRKRTFSELYLKCILLRIIPKNILVKGWTGRVSMCHSSVKAAEWEMGPGKDLSRFGKDKAVWGGMHFAQV